MASKQNLPRPFSLHWGSGRVVEEASYEGEHHVPSLQLLEFTEGEAAGARSVRFCFYSHDGRFQRSPLIVNEAEVEGLRRALAQNPGLRAFLQRLVE